MAKLLMPRGAPGSFLKRNVTSARRDGFCIRCEVDDVGEAIGKLAEGGGRFEGYTDAAASERKILLDVFERVDAWYRTGDLMRKDRTGYFYFVDRLGDTFRWKGENVSTTEVEEAIATCPGVIEAVVCGTRCPVRRGAPAWRRWSRTPN